VNFEEWFNENYKTTKMLAMAQPSIREEFGKCWREAEKEGRRIMAKEVKKELYDMSCEISLNLTLDFIDWLNKESKAPIPPAPKGAGILGD
jgi:hypothetical protein